MHELHMLLHEAPGFFHCSGITYISRWSKRCYTFLYVIVLMVGYDMLHRYIHTKMIDIFGNMCNSTGKRIDTYVEHSLLVGFKWFLPCLAI